jgi:polyhydroxybutyrate depolymerase
VDAEPPPPSQVILDRPYELRVPDTYDASKPAPLVIALHGYGDNDDATSLEKWMRLTPTANSRGFLYALPNGTFDSTHQRFWNATDACCNFFGSKVDDVGYIAAVIDDVARTHNLDRKRVFITGISGGAIMAHRLACDLSDRIAAIVSISGTTWKDASKCQPTSAVSVVELHGDKDDVVPYEGGSLDGNDPIPIPSAHETVQRWATSNGCTGQLAPTGARLDLETAVAGAETRVEAYGGCAHGDVELWTAEGGPHASYFTSTFAPTLFDYFEGHARP